MLVSGSPVAIFNENHRSVMVLIGDGFPDHDLIPLDFGFPPTLGAKIPAAGGK